MNFCGSCKTASYCRLNAQYLELLLQPLKDACDRDWEDETPEQVVAIAANAIYWRGRAANKQREDK